MALEGKVTVIPVAMIGTDKAQPTGKVIPRIMRIGVRIGKPLDFSRYEGMEDDRFVLRSITDEIMYELMLLSGHEYVDMYATSMKDRIVAAARARAKELQDAAKPGAAAPELEEALDAAEGRRRARHVIRARKSVDPASTRATGPPTRATSDATRTGPGPVVGGLLTMADGAGADEPMRRSRSTSTPSCGDCGAASTSSGARPRLRGVVGLAPP